MPLCRAVLWKLYAHIHELALPIAVWLFWVESSNAHKQVLKSEGRPKPWKESRFHPFLKKVVSGSTHMRCCQVGSHLKYIGSLKRKSLAMFYRGLGLALLITLGCYLAEDSCCFQMKSLSINQLKCFLWSIFCIIFPPFFSFSLPPHNHDPWYNHETLLSSDQYVVPLSGKEKHRSLPTQ